MNRIIAQKMKSRHMLADSATVGMVQPEGKEFKVDVGNRLLKFIATAEEVDADRELVIASGANTSYFFKNRNVFVDHTYDIKSFVGKLRHATPWNGQKSTTFGAADHNSWWCTVHILPLSGNPLCDDILTMAEAGGIGTSIGYEIREQSKPTDGEKARYCRGGKTLRNVLRKWDWLEQTLTAMPALVDSQALPMIDGKRAAVIEELLTKAKIQPETAKMVGFPLKEKRRIVVEV